MLLIHFTGSDLGRIRIPSVPDLMWEAVNAVQLLQHRDGQLIFDRWRRQVLDHARKRAVNAEVRTFAALSPHAAYFPDFLTPIAPSEGIETAIDTVLSTPRQRLHMEMTRLACDRRLPNWAGGVADGDLDTMHRIGMAIHEFHEVAIKPFLDQITGGLHAECARRTRVAMRGGAEALLNSFRPLMAWTPPVLHVRYPLDQTLHLNGRGLRLIPAFFCWRYPVTLVDSELTPTLVYPIDHLPSWSNRHLDQSGLGALIGPTRAAILAAMANGCTTTLAAHLAHVSPATATHHANILRNANLITSQREGNTVVHTTTPLGTELLISTSL